MLREALVWGRSCWEHERLSTALVVSGLVRQSPESSAEKVGWGWRGVAWRRGHECGQVGMTWWAWSRGLASGRGHGCGQVGVSWWAKPGSSASPKSQHLPLSLSHTGLLRFRFFKRWVSW